MKRPTLVPAVILLALFTFSCSTDPLEDTIDTTVSNFVPETKTIEIEILELINEHRLSIGLNDLEVMDRIKAEAFTHTDYMIENDDVSHANFFVRKTNLENTVGAVRVSENLAFGYTTAESVVNAWLNSEGHRANIEGQFTAFDISAEQDEDGKWYYTNIFVKK